MICLLALLVFGILAIFSATHRPLFKEALECVFLRIRFKPCKSNLDQRIKASLTGRIMVKSPKLAGFTYKYFEVISWFFTILMIVSLIYSGIAVYNLAVHGNCNGPGPDGTIPPYCILTGSGGAAVPPVPTCPNPELCNTNCTCIGKDCGPECQTCNETKNL